jgi:hypothetical protein
LGLSGYIKVRPVEEGVFKRRGMKRLVEACRKRR